MDHCDTVTTVDTRPLYLPLFGVGTPRTLHVPRSSTGLRVERKSAPRLDGARGDGGERHENDAVCVFTVLTHPTFSYTENCSDDDTGPVLFVLSLSVDSPCDTRLQSEGRVPLEGDHRLKYRPEGQERSFDSFSRIERRSIVVPYCLY